MTLTGPSCSGKSTIEAELAELGMHKTTSTTTRTPRAGEVNGEHYHFVTPEVFVSMIRNGELVEHVDYGGKFYGLSKAEFEKGFAAGKAVIAVVEPNGRNQIGTFCEKHGWRHVPVFIDGNPEVMLQRLSARYIKDLSNAKITDLENEPLVSAERIYDIFEKRLAMMRIVEFDWMREARTRQYPYSAYIRVSNEQNFIMIVRFLEGLVAAHQEPGTMFNPENMPYGLGDRALFEPWIRAA
jgi:guanylate kinase